MLRAYLNSWKPMFALPKPIWVLAWCGLVNRVGTMVMPFLALYVTKHLGFSAEQAGVLMGTYGVGALLMSPITGHLCDRFGGPASPSAWFPLSYFCASVLPARKTVRIALCRETANSASVRLRR